MTRSQCSDAPGGFFTVLELPMFEADTLDKWLSHIEVLHSKPIDMGL